MRRRVWVNDRGHAIGQDHHRAKLADADIQMIVELRDAGLSWREIAGKFDDVPGGVSVRHVRNAYHGIRRGHTAVRTKLVGKG